MAAMRKSADPWADPRYERFCQERAKGEFQLKAYHNAGFIGKNAKAEASRLDARPIIRARIEEILKAAAEKAEVTIADMVAQLDEDRAFARKLEAPAAATSATMGKAKILGFLTERTEISGPGGAPIQTESKLDIGGLNDDQLRALASIKIPTG